MAKELENTILGLLALHPNASGYDLHRIIEDSTGHLLNASFSKIYPSLKKLSNHELVEYEVEDIKNRPAKKYYCLTDLGEKALQEWLKSPISFKPDLRSFDLRIVFGPLMPKKVLLFHIDSAIQYLENITDERFFSHDVSDGESYAFIRSSSVNMHNIDIVWRPFNERFREEHLRRLQWMREWRDTIEQEFEE